VLIRAELSRVLLDLTAAGSAARLVAVRAALPRALALLAALTGADDGRTGERTARWRGKVAPVALAAPGAGSMSGDDPDDGTPDDLGDARGRLVPASERRQAAEILVGLWADVARDLALVEAGGGRSVRDPVLLEELSATAAGVDPEAVAGFLDRTARGAELLAANVSPELLLDSLALAWPRRRVA
jgi:hypothetical protein